MIKRECVTTVQLDWWGGRIHTSPEMTVERLASFVAECVEAGLTRVTITESGLVATKRESMK